MEGQIRVWGRLGHLAPVLLGEDSGRRFGWHERDVFVGDPGWYSSINARITDSGDVVASRRRDLIGVGRRRDWVHPHRSPVGFLDDHR